MDLIVIGLAILVQKASDFRLHQLNRAFLDEHGAKWATTRWTRLWFWGDLVFLGMALLESGALRTRQPGWIMAIGFVVWMAAVGLRYWVRQSLGAMWTLDLVLVPGASRVISGPYRWMRHPDYVGRLLEVVGVCMVLQSVWAGMAYLGLMLVVLPPILVLERRQIQFLS